MPDNEKPFTCDVVYLPLVMTKGATESARLEWYRREFAGVLGGVKRVHSRHVDGGAAVLLSGDGSSSHGHHHLYHSQTSPKAGECRFGWFDKDGSPLPDDFKGIKFGVLTPEGADDKPED